MLDEHAIRALRSFLGPGQVITDPAELLVYEVDAAQDRGSPDAVVLPHSADEVCRLVEWANRYSLALISRGGGTGLSGGAVAERGGVIVEFSRMNRICELDPVGRSARVEPGVISQALDEQTKAQGWYYPPDPSSGRASTLGGNVAENAGGPHCFKYGVTTNYLTGLEVVLADGRQVHLGGRALDVPEFDFLGLLAGSEGTLGLITGIAVRLLRQPAGVKTLMAAFDSVEQAGRAVSAVIAAGLIPAAMEMMDQKICRIVEDFAHPGLPTEAGALLVVDVDGYPAGLDVQIEEIAELLRREGATELRIARSAEERERIWYARKSAAGAMARLAPAYLLLDGTVPRSRLAEALAATDRICEAYGLRVGYVFHAGDGNLHPFILMYPDDPAQVARVRQAGREFMEQVIRLGGSITGEHGVGIEKRAYMNLMVSPADLRAMLEVRAVFDPHRRLNPGKIFPDEAVEASLPLEAGQPPEEPWQPASAEAAAAGLAALTRARRPVVIRGGAATTGDLSVPAGGLVLSTCRLDRLEELAPNDLSVRAGAGMRLADLQALLAREGKWLPVAAPDPEATLGGVLSANWNAPLRMRYGGLRDQVLALTVALANGQVVRMGRPVVKNVAGYDLAKLMIGAHGTLGLIAEVTFKFTALPRWRASLRVPVERLEPGLAWGARCLAQARVASAVVLTRGVPALGTVPGADPQAMELTFTAEGLREDVEAELDRVRQELRAAGAPEPALDERVSGTDLWRRLLGADPGDRLRVRCAVAPKDLGGFAAAQRDLLGAAPLLVDFASGFLYAALEARDPQAVIRQVEALRTAALHSGGYLVAQNCPPALAGQMDPWGYRPETLPEMRQLKSRWDPANILNPSGFFRFS